MDFTLSDEHQAVREAAEVLFQGRVTVERLKSIERSDDRVDRDLWADLARANLLGVCLPEDHGGSGLDLVALALLLEQQGRAVAPVPLLATSAAALTVAEHGTSHQKASLLPPVVAGDVILTSALEDSWGPATVHVTVDRRLVGRCTAVPAGHVAHRVLVPADGSLWLVDPRGPGVEIERAEATDRSIVAHLALDGAAAERLGGETGIDTPDGTAERRLRECSQVGVCALQVGVCEAALRLTARYTSSREQFGRPLSTNQAVAVRAADAYVDIEAMRATMLQAAWRLGVGLPATDAVLVAKWWASDAGDRVVHATQHLHGGIGADIDYPVHRYFLWGKQLANALGGASRTLAALGDELATAVVNAG